MTFCPCNRSPCGAVGHGGHYHSQSPEAYLAHTPGITVCMPRSPRTAKGLLLAAIRSRDPVIFLEPKALYRASVEEVPVGDYELPLRQADVVREGTDVTLVGWGRQLLVLEAACDMAAEQHGISAELIDLQTIVPWDVATVEASVLKTGKCQWAPCDGSFVSYRLCDGCHCAQQQSWCARI